MENMDRNGGTVDSDISDEEFKEMRSLLYQSTLDHIDKVTKGIFILAEDLHNIRKKMEQNEKSMVDVFNRIEAYE